MIDRATENSINQNGLWAITAYFNPRAYQRRLANYRIFREHLSVPLLTVEMSCGREFELRDDDAEVLVRRRARDVMWQKERLLNLAIDLLPGDCRSVVWIDCDLVALRADWPAEAARVLEVYPVAQGFRHVWDLPHDASVDRFAASIAGPRVTSYASQIATGAITVDALGGHRSREAGGGGTGYVWAARRELIQQHRLYDANIVGGGDKAFLCAVFGRLAANIDAQCMGPRRARHYVDWAGPLHDAVGGRVGFVDVDLVHLWHGDLGARGYGERHQRLADFDFDPLADLALDEGACWRWSSAKPAMHAWVRSYFESRKEDG